MPKEPEAVRLGFFKNAQGQWLPLRYKEPGNMITVAPPRAGKFRDILCAAILDFMGSLIVIDPKGEIASVTLAEREKRGPVYILNPFDEQPEILGGNAARYNPFARLDPTSRALGEDCSTLANAIVQREGTGGDSNSKHFEDSAESLLTAVLLQLVTAFPPEKRTLRALRDTVSSLKSARTFARLAWKHPESRTFVRQELEQYAFSDPYGENRELEGICSTAKRQTNFLHDAIADNTAASDFAFRDLKREPATVYVILPEQYREGSIRWFRLIIAAALKELLQFERGVPVLMLIDEFNAIGHMKVIENTMSRTGGMGLRLWLIVQYLSQLEGTYGKAWQGFLGAAGARQFFRSDELFTAEYVSKLCGKVWHVMPSAGTSTNTSNNPNGGGTGTSSSSALQQLDRLTPVQTMNIGDNEFVLFTSATGARATFGVRAPYFDAVRHPELQGRYSPNPYYDPEGAAAEAQRRHAKANRTAPPPVPNEAPLLAESALDEDDSQDEPVPETTSPTTEQPPEVDAEYRAAMERILSEWKRREADPNADPTEIKKWLSSELAPWGVGPWALHPTTEQETGGSEDPPHETDSPSSTSE